MKTNKRKKTIKMNSNNLIEELLNSLSPEESLRIENRMLMAAKLDEAIKAKGWKKKTS